MGETNSLISIIILLSQIHFYFATAAATVCPKPVVDDIGVSYNTPARFDKIRTEKSTLSAKFKRKGKDVSYLFRFCGPKDSWAMKETIGDKEAIVSTFKESSTLIGAEDWLLLRYFDGDKYEANICGGKKRQTWISIRCEERGETPTLKLIEDPQFNTGTRHKDTECYHMFEYNHPAACSKKPLSGWTIFFIILIVLFSAYFISGILYKRFLKGAKGRDQIPHNTFWEKFGNLMADGCAYVCRREEPSNTYQGMADQLNIDNSDEEDILPM